MSRKFRLRDGTNDRNGSRRRIVDPMRRHAMNHPGGGEPRNAEDSEPGKHASVDRATGEVHGSGSGAGGNGNPAEDYDDDPIAGGGPDPIGGPRPAEDAVD